MRAACERRFDGIVDVNGCVFARRAGRHIDVDPRPDFHCRAGPGHRPLGFAEHVIGRQPRPGECLKRRAFGLLQAIGQLEGLVRG